MMDVIRFYRLYKIYISSCLFALLTIYARLGLQL